MPLSAGTVNYHYERISTDPLVSQSLPLQYDAFGCPFWQVNVVYPRRLTDKSDNPYTGILLPTNACHGIFDKQQVWLRLTESRMQVKN
jgi:hypothetical protein